MNENKSKSIPQVILAPLTGKAVPLSEVPDPVFSEKVLGGGVAIIPADGKIVSPVDGERYQQWQRPVMHMDLHQRTDRKYWFMSGWRQCH